MFVRKHAYTIINKTQKFKQIKINTLCKKAFKVNKEAIKKYKQLKIIYNKIIQRQILKINKF